MKKILMIGVALCLFGCGGFRGIFTDEQIRQGIARGQIHLGASQWEVEQAVRRPFTTCIQSKTTTEGTYEAWIYNGRGMCGSNFSQSYILIFKDGILTEIRQI